MRSLPSSSPAASVTTPAKCGSSPSTLIPHRHDKHLLTCDNDKTDSWTDGWTRQPPVYSGVLLFLKRNTPIQPQDMTNRYDSPGSAARGSLPSRNTGQIQIQFSTVADTAQIPGSLRITAA